MSITTDTNPYTVLQFPFELGVKQGDLIGQEIKYISLNRNILLLLTN